ncbi:hypothetical protein [Caballeronia concitans]|uniref:Lipoprotein n=1 Tax=Caballeronia concitans TaxID=1777133 RepID=A0A658QPY8_9BURK|nr:hypothetical protein [Caballeronia concitans]KIG05338.1 hypothetical protein BurMR1_3651 [Burkholderia sp. MR1]SAL08965.1 hypothetical protein AWB72_00036 [Caballeronia concitans]
MTKTNRTAFLYPIRSALLLSACLAASHGVLAQSAPQPVDWELQVVRDGQQIDSFSATTNVGQARTDTHHDVVQNRVGCADKPAGDIDLQRTVTVSPTHASADDITLAIDAQETIEDDASRTSTSGCKVPPTPRQVSGSHPGLVVKPGEWAQWQIIDSNPSLAYRVRASLAPSAPAE